MPDYKKKSLYLPQTIKNVLGMKQIKSFGIASLHVEESFGYLQQIETETANLPDENPPALQTEAVTTFKTAVEAFDEALKVTAVDPTSATTTDTDDARDVSWRGANSYTKAMCAHPNATLAAYATEAKSIFDKYGNPTKLAQTEESGVLHNLVQDLEAWDASKRAAIYLDEWIADMKAKEEAFLAAVTERTETEAARQVGIVKETRTAAEAAYRSLVDTINALAMINGDTTFATFIDHVNALIDRQKTILKSRATRAKKEDEAPGED